MVVDTDRNSVTTSTQQVKSGHGIQLVEEWEIPKIQCGACSGGGGEKCSIFGGDSGEAGQQPSRSSPRLNLSGRRYLLALPLSTRFADPANPSTSLHT